MTAPYSENVFFLDTEFTTLDPNNGQLLSIAMVKLDGSELYIELEQDKDAEVSDFVKEHVLPMLTAPKVSKEEARRQIREFIGKGRPYPVCDVTPLDTMYMFKLFFGEELPFHWLSVDMTSILFGAGRNPHGNEVQESLGIDLSQYRSHHALDDARLLRDTYIRFYESQKQA